MLLKYLKKIYRFQNISFNNFDTTIQNNEKLKLSFIHPNKLKINIQKSIIKLQFTLFPK